MTKQPGDQENDSVDTKLSGDASAKPLTDASADAGDPPTESLQPETGSASVAGENAAGNGPIEEITLSELIRMGLRAPRSTWRRLKVAMIAPVAYQIQDSARPAFDSIQTSAASESGSSFGIQLSSLWRGLRKADALQLLLYGSAIICALIGSVIVRGSAAATRADGVSLSIGGPYLLLAFLLWLIAEFVGRRAQLMRYWRGLDRSARLHWAARALPLLLWLSALFALAAPTTAPRETTTELALTAFGRFAFGGLLWIVIEFAAWQARRRAQLKAADAQKIMDRRPMRPPILKEVSHRRKLLIVLAALCSLLVWANTSGNRIEPPVILLWLLSAALWGFVFAPLRWNAFDWASGALDRIRRICWRDHRGAIIALALILLVGGAFRFYQLEAYPPQMFSDLVEKIQDAYKIHHLNDYRIFLENIGGREPIHFYLLSILASQPGMEFDHYALKLMSALESFIALPIVFLLGVEVMGKDRRRLGLLLGALAAALVAVSFWHTAIGRQGMRISLAPLFSALTALYFVRALRANQRADFVKAGIALGFGLLGYQAIRMLPLAAVSGVAFAALLGRYTWRARLSYLLNLAVLAFVSLMVFLPLLHYWTEEPENYMRRASTRMFGDLPTTDEERAAFLNESIPALMGNIGKTALMYHYHGDNAWSSGLSHEPAMDPVSAAFMLLGVSAWLALLAQTRDPALWFVPIYLLTMLLPTTLALSFPIEVPSFTRASGAIPPSYLIAALPVAVFCLCLCKTIPGKAGKLVATLFAAVVLLAANQYNTSLYFGEFIDNFNRASLPHAQAGKFLRGFVDSDGAAGNAFVLATPHWWDTRAIGIEAGLLLWDGSGHAQTVPQLLERGLRKAAPYQLNPERDLIFFYSRQNTEALGLLAGWFPDGRQLQVDVEPAYKSFYVFRAPALGVDSLNRFLAENQ